MVSPYGGLPAAIGNDLASAVSEGEARQNKPQTYSQIQHWERQRLVKDQRRLGRQKIKIEALDLEHSMNYVHDLFLSVGVGNHGSGPRRRSRHARVAGAVFGHDRDLGAGIATL